MTNEQKGGSMNTGLLKEILSDVVADLPVLVKTADGRKRVSCAYEEILWDEKTVPGNELEAFCVELRADKSVSNVAKYAPCRRFKKGDRVRVVEWNGRKTLRNGMIGYVVADECNCQVELAIDSWPKDIFYHAAFLELVTPVEELEPYRVEETTDYFSIEKDDEELCLYWKDKHPNPKEAAEAECARLNEEHRKEQE